MTFDNIPDGYRLEHFLNGSAHTIVDTETFESFQLCDRDFQEIDLFLGSLPSKIIGEKIRLGFPLPMKVLDVGGGSQSRAMQTMASSMLYGRNVFAVNIDLCAQPNMATENMLPIRGNAMDLTQYFNPNTFDLVVSTQLFPSFRRNDYSRQIKILDGIAQILKKGGVAMIDENPDTIRTQQETIKNCLQTYNPHIRLLQHHNGVIFMYKAT